MPIIPILFFGLLTALLAARKGYNPLCWFFAGGVVGLIVLAFRPFTNNVGLSDSDRIALQQEGNRIGLIVSGVMLGLALFLTLLLNSLR
jgi:hypothetical protein